MQKAAIAGHAETSLVESLEPHVLRAQLREKERTLSTLMGNLRGIVYRCRIDEHWTMEFVSDGCRELTGYEPGELVLNGRISYEELIHPDDRLRLRAQIATALEQKERFSIEYRIVCLDGSVKWVAEIGVGVYDATHSGLEGFIHDISERKVAERALLEAERKYRSIFENATEGIFQSTAEGRYLEANPALARIYGYDTPGALVASLSNIGAQLYVEPGRREEFERLVRAHGAVQGFVSQVYRRDGEVIWVSENARPVYDHAGRLLHYEGTVVDVSDSRRYEEQLKHQASHDALTHLPNRALLYDRLSQAIAHATRYGGLVGVAFVDLDYFKIVNDSLGHDTGDALLKAMAERMTACVRGSDTVARPGGDEFVLVISGEPDEAALAFTLERIRKGVAEPWQAHGRELRVTCSIGAALYPRDGADDATLLKNADIAMYRAKAAGRNAIEFFSGGGVNRER
jgi:diguanylate cyclase (GGDEF)-like protein/PAS domain S-box-containing protein